MCRRARSSSLSRRSCRARASSAVGKGVSSNGAGEVSLPGAYLNPFTDCGHRRQRTRTAPSTTLGELIRHAALAGLLLTLLVVWLVVNLVKEPSYFVTISFIGLTNGAVYALVALGYTSSTAFSS